MTPELREGLAKEIALVFHKKGMAPLAMADACLAYLGRNDSAHVYVNDDELSALDLRSPFNACSLKGRCIQTADALDHAHDGHAEFVRKVREIAERAISRHEVGLGEGLGPITTIAALCDAELAKEQSK